MNINVVEKIDETLDQLIRNAEVISNAQLDCLSEAELEAFQKTQESLMNHLLQMDQCLVQVKKSASFKLHEKRARFEELKLTYAQQLTETLERRPILAKRRAKKFFDFNGRRPKVKLVRN
jgi:uncharacterized protein YjgD (DUF1641 family)